MPGEFTKAVRTAKRPRIAVIGDVMIDVSVTGDASRLSAEAPVPILAAHGPAFAVPGGAANVVRQLKHWNCDVFLLGLVDPDAVAVHDRFGISDRHSVLLKGGQVPLKMRFLDGDRQLLRCDFEQLDYGLGPSVLAQARAHLVHRLMHLLTEGLAAVIFADYAKGALDAASIAQLLMACRIHNTWSVADTKKRCSREWAGLDVAKFSHNEYHGARELPHVVTHGARPPVLFRPQEGIPGWRLETAGPELDVPVRSVAGAGDCFTAVLTWGLVHGLDLAEAAEAAHQAGAVYVQHRDNAPVLPVEVFRRLSPAAGKIATAAEIRAWLDVRKPEARVVFTNGVFDLLHAGHLATLRWAKQQGDILIVGVNDDASARRIKGPGRPVMAEVERSLHLAELDAVDWVVVFGEDSPEAVMRSLRPTVLVKGPEYLGREQALPGADLVSEVLIATDSRWPRHTSDLVRDGAA